MSLPDNASVPEPRLLPSRLRAALRCPLSGDELVDGIDDTGHPTLVSQNAGLAYPVRDGVPILLVHEARRVCAPDPDPLG